MRIAATIATLEHDHVLIRGRDGREWRLVLQDVPTDLRCEGQPIFMNHDCDGWVTSITSRTPDDLPPEIQGRIDEMQRWCGSL
jgi:hypothetical protein